MPTVKIYCRNVYGNALIYPANETAEALAKLTRKKTLDGGDINVIKSLGFTVEQVADPQLVTVAL